MLAMIAVRNEIRDMLGGERGKIILRTMYKFSASNNNSCRLCEINWYIESGKASELLRFDSVCHGEVFGPILAVVVTYRCSDPL
jgi:hypothetical protein